MFRQPKTITVETETDTDEGTVYEQATVRISEMTVMRFGRAMSVLEPLSKEIATLDFRRVAVKHQAEMNEFLGIAIGWPAERVATLSSGSFIRILNAVQEANPHFFPWLLGPVESERRETTPVRTNGAGEPLSPTSESTETSPIQSASL